MSKDAVVSVVLGSYERLKYLKAAIESIREELRNVEHEIIVVDGGSTDGALEWAVQQKDIITIVQHNRGKWKGKPIERKTWGYFMNLGFKCSKGKYICMLSDDCLVVPRAIKNGIGLFERKLKEGKNVGAVAFYWRDWPDRKDYWVGLTLGDKMFVNHGLYLRKAVEEVGWIEEERYRFYHADGDLCLKLWERGYEIIDCPDAFVEHFSHTNLKVRSSNLDQQKADWTAYLDRWTGIFYDPAKGNIGSWICRSHHDSFKTVSRFPKADVIHFLFRSAIRKTMRCGTDLLNRFATRMFSSAKR